jgi:hypothetical protein
MMAGGEWGSAVGSIGAAALSAVGLVVAGVIAARATAQATRTTHEAEGAARASDHAADCEALVRALARAYDELRLWAQHPHGEPPRPNERARRYFDTGT